MKPDNAGEDMWLRVETANEKLKQEAPTQKGDDICVRYDAARGSISTLLCFFHGGGGWVGSSGSPAPPTRFS